MSGGTWKATKYANDGKGAVQSSDSGNFTVDVTECSITLTIGGSGLKLVGFLSKDKQIIDGTSIDNAKIGVAWGCHRSVTPPCNMATVAGKYQAVSLTVMNGMPLSFVAKSTLDTNGHVTTVTTSSGMPSKVTTGNYTISSDCFLIRTIENSVDVFVMNQDKSGLFMTMLPGPADIGYVNPSW